MQLGPNRLYFIDAVRAFAIIMMLQGHFVDTLLAEEFRDPQNSIFQVWKYFRGITAPTFFTISGLIFTYLLMRSKKNGTSAKRIRKGLWRGLMLIGIGYALRAPVFDWLQGQFRDYFLIVDVLQCIGLSLLITVLIYMLTLKKSAVFSVIMICLGTLIFICEPLYRSLEVSHLPLFLANYLTKSNGSVFTIIPWFGYMSYGAFIATLFYGFLEKDRFKPLLIGGLIISGGLLIFYSSFFFNWIFLQFDWPLFRDVAFFNYLFTRLGNVLLLFGLFYTFERFIKQSLILRIGQKTLSIYVIHFVIIYGSITGLGLHQLIGKVLTPYEAACGAIIFVCLVCTLALYGIQTNQFVYQKLRTWLLESADQETNLES
ncbi:heparan-alpha-glucosaminide N-acetyltransferase domain-containing protein [Nonlabens xiamenensis]|uniref:heparan-alpha-glucosaminide N-acetyltransferase domain-containing protein n=1 Tax=Nonlabens xiamenensis TaxID=2341043 RepID=UPI001F0BDFD3|nr:heparan-alpha-glucosaminide N-acetyltransferase domain-containing protein [Nonlabens xiamenensis]